MKDKYFQIKDVLPKKGVDIIGFDNDNNRYYCFRCNCHNQECLEWRCSLTGSHLMINVVKWNYDN